MVLTEDQICEIWNFFGGSCWEIQFLLSEIMIFGFEKAVTRQKKEKESEIKNALAFNPLRKQLLSLFKDKETLDEDVIIQQTTIQEDKLKGLLGELVTENILFFDPIEAVYGPQGKSVEFGINKYFK